MPVSERVYYIAVLIASVYRVRRVSHLLSLSPEMETGVMGRCSNVRSVIHLNPTVLCHSLSGCFSHALSCKYSNTGAAREMLMSSYNSEKFTELATMYTY